MILFNHRMEFCFSSERCCQCGICLAVCPVNALTMKERENGLFDVTCNIDLCIKCGKCASVCPGKELSEKILTEEEWRKVSSSFLAYSNDSSLRYSSSSGGVVRTLIRELLEKGIVDTAYCAIKSTRFPFAEGGYLNKGFDIASIANSTYMSFPLLINCNPLQPGTKLLAVGTNCQLLALSRFYENSDIELFQIALFCKQQKHKGYIRYMNKRFNLSYSSSIPILFRGQGWPGNTGTEHACMRFTEMAALPFSKRLWNVPSCSVCANAIGVTADISIGDPWNIITEPKACGGMSLCVILSKRGRVISQSANNELSFIDVGLEMVKKSIGWNGLQRHISTIPIRLHKKGSILNKTRVYLFSIQCHILERILLHWRFPRVFLKMLTKLLPSE